MTANMNVHCAPTSALATWLQSRLQPAGGTVRIRNRLGFYGRVLAKGCRTGFSRAPLRTSDAEIGNGRRYQLVNPA